MRSKALLTPLKYIAALAGIVMVEAGDSITQPSTTGMTNKAIESSTISNSYCHSTSNGHFTVYTETWGYNYQSHCDEGMMDNIRHQCRTWPQDWKCVPNGTEKYPHGASATWTMTNWVQDGCVEKAISMAAQMNGAKEDGLTCTGVQESAGLRVSRFGRDTLSVICILVSMWVLI